MIRIKAIGLAVLRKCFGELRWAEFQRNRGQIDANTYYDRLVEQIIARVVKPESVCIDVGAHKGSMLRLMIQHAPAGTFFAFEPLPYLYEELVQTFNHKNVNIYNVALSDSSGKSSFNYVITNPGYSGLKKRRYDRPNEKDTQITVKTDTLDAILSEANARKITFIKIDVEGAEYFVLKGAQSHIKKDKPFIVFEHGLGGSDYYNKRPEDIYQLLADECGLRISLLSDWLRRKPALSFHEFCDQFYQGKNYYFMAHP